MKKESNEQKGITLVALVITVIVLIILAGVTLSTLVGDNGIITKSKEAKQNMANASAEEEELIQNLLNEIKGAEGGEIEIPEGTIEFGEVTWSNGQAEVEIKAKTGEGESLQYQVNAKGEGGWKGIASGERITGLKHGDTVNARLWNGETAVVEKSKKIEDTKAPEVSIQVGEVTDSSIEVIVQAAENETGLLEVETYEYYIGEHEALDGRSLSNKYVYKNGIQPETEYILTVKVPDKAGNVGKASIKQRTDEKSGIPTTESYVGYYADIEGDGTVDGVIYADLAVGNTGSGQWGDINGKYQIPIKSKLNSYYISKENYTDKFGTKPVISQKNGTRVDRFYVMALTDSAGIFYWYKAAYGKMSIDTSRDWGTGKQNTQTMINQWNTNKYSKQNNNDIWANIQTQVKNGWFVPSQEEWSAFAGELEIKKNNYVKLGLKDEYWSSSQDGIYNSVRAIFKIGSLYFGNVNNEKNVRLSITF